MKKNILDFVQQNSPDGGFLQSEHWRNFQESVGRKTCTFFVEYSGELIAYANIITHTLPVVGDYFYVPRGPIIEAKSEKRKVKDYNAKLKNFFIDLISFAEKNNIGWIRVEPNNEENLDLIKSSMLKNIKIKKSFIDMQPKEILIMDISGSEEKILAGMKQKTRYNIKLSQKRGVFVKVISNFQFPISKQYIDDFLRLIKITAERDKILPHPENYYRKMFGAIPPEILKLYVAEYEGKTIAANLMVFFGKTATYLHGASDNIHRDVMAPYLLQWRAIQDAKKAECIRYDFGGVKIQGSNSWAGITRFKVGFAPNVEPIRFPGCYDIIIKPGRYCLYRIFQKAKRIF